ncbi:MAG TPA: hypothetical protein VK927_05320, partial [Adhaeribacter sp.]|nr:hypothetical protein [Adhaeribacter sp.]
LLLFFLLHNLAKTRMKALALAETMTLEYRKLNRELDQKVHERTSELAEKNKKLNLYTEHLKNAYEDLETKVKFRSMDLEKQIKKLKAENEALKGNQQ